jgi:outer membrane protein assembly factor BamB
MILQHVRLLPACGLAAFLASWTVVSCRAAETAADILQQTGVRGGFVVHLGCGDGQLTAGLRAGDGYMVHGLTSSAMELKAARERLLKQGVYGPVSLDLLAGDRLPYIDNFVNLVVAENPGNVSQQEIERVLCPRGVAYVKRNGQWQKTVKAVPKEIDDWTHYFHDAGGNPVAHDTVVAPPERLQWVGTPRYSRHHDRMASMSALVSSLGRLFYIIDEGSRVSIELPSHWKLMARDAFNGTVLWERNIDKWHDQMWPLKSGPTQLARRLVADGDLLYVTLGYHAPVTCLDGATGQVRRVYNETKTAEEMVVHDGTLYVLVNEKASELDDYAPKFNVGDQRRVAEEYNWNQAPREIHALDAATGKLLWKREGKVAPLTLAVNDRHAVYHDGDRIFSLDRKTGQERWASEPAPRRRFVTFNFGPRLLVHDDVVLYAGGEGKMRGYAAADGKTLWESEHAPSGYQSPQDLLVTGGLVWVAPTTSGRDSGIYKGRDIHTGEVKVEFPPDIDTYWFHHRCYIAKATDSFIIPSRTGIELVDFSAKHWDINHWVRGGCLYGVLPCNGLLYAPPHNCACYPEAKLYGFNALAPAATSPVIPEKIDEGARLERGPAYDAPIQQNAAAGKEWPTYRGDNARSGYSPEGLNKDLERSWERHLTGKLTAMVVADNKVFVAQTDQHTLHALDAAQGNPLWTYTAGGRIDSPPTIYKGRALFGCADGWVYCLRTSDGALAWRYRAAPVDRRLMSFEQLESVWPVHGSVLVEDDVLHFVVGRSSFLDKGMWYMRLDPRTGQKLAETALNDRDPETGGDLQDRLRTLQMPVGLNDILSSDGQNIYLRSQKFDKQGQRTEIGPVSGDAVQQGGAQSGEGRHIFAPMGFLDDTWYHRSYWVYGKNFAGGHNGYYQAGKFTPSGRILVFNDKEIFGYARQPQYYRWTTPLEHQVFSASRDAVGKPPAAGGPAQANRAANSLTIANSESLDPAKKPLTVEAWISLDGPNGVIVSHGGPANGYALVLRQRKPAFMIRTGGELATVEAPERLEEGWNHLAGVLDADHSIRLYVNGTLAAEAQTANLIAAAPKQPLELGADSAGSVGDYQTPFPFAGTIDEVRIYHRALTADEISLSVNDAEKSRQRSKEAALALSFDAGNAKDESGNKNDGQLGRLPTGQGKLGTALVIPRTAGGNAQATGTSFQHTWTRFAPVFARSMVLSGSQLVFAGPPDDVDSEYALERLAAKDPAIHEALKLQDENLQGKHGARLWVMDTRDGTQLTEVQLDSLPVWDGMSSAYGRLYIATQDGRVVCLGR